MFGIILLFLLFILFIYRKDIVKLYYLIRSYLRCRKRDIVKENKKIADKINEDYSRKNYNKIIGDLIREHHINNYPEHKKDIDYIEISKSVYEKIFDVINLDFRHDTCSVIESNSSLNQNISNLDRVIGIVGGITVDRNGNYNALGQRISTYQCAFGNFRIKINSELKNDEIRIITKDYRYNPIDDI